MSDFEIVQVQNPTIFQIAGGLNYRGEYDNGTEYAIGDVVYFEGSSYVSIADSNTGNAVTDDSKWQLIAQMGDTGVKGDTGVTGAQGVKGDTGNTGSTGAKGDTGSQGAAGNTGVQGVKGDTGNTGSAGAKGDTGSQGAVGNTGVQGDTGIGMDWQGAWDSGETYDVPMAVEHNGSSYIAIAESTDKEPGVDADWEDFWSLIVEKGDTGAQGVQGNTGVTGSQGVKGDTGSTGSTGAKGDTGNTGSQGVAGNTGVQGAKGDTGSTGSAGSQGAKGDTGDQGEQGDTGSGEQGDQGDTGTQGAQGNTGVKGDTGNPGGVSFYQTFDSATTEADPGNGEFRLNHATLSSVTEIYLDDLDGGGTDIIDLVAAFDDAGNPVKGFLEIRRASAPTNWVLFRINSLTDESGYTQLNVAYVDHAGTITGLCEMLFTRAGDKGDTGATGSTGSQGAKGDTGDQGDQGDTGAQGNAGSQGAKGDTGDQGDQGDTGATGSQGAKGDTGNQGAAGNTGVKGDTGNPGGFSFLQTFDSATTEADPGAGEFRLNHATLSSVTEIYVDDEDSGATDIIDMVASMDDASNSIDGYLKIFRLSAPTNWALYKITSLADESGYTQLNVTYVDHAGSLTGLCVLTFTPAGDKGDTGSAGSTGSQGAKGDTGNTGSQGAAGNTGVQGATGVTGATGVASPTLSVADDSFSGITASLTAGTGVTIGQICYVGSDGKMEHADADAIATSSAIAIALGTIAENAAGSFGLWGFMRDDSAYNFTPGQLIYLSTTAAGITTTAPSGADDVIQILGVALTADIWFFCPQLVQVEHTG